MSIKLVILKSGENIISDVKELLSDNKVCWYLFTKPHVVELEKNFLLVEENQSPKGDVNVILSPWIVLAKDSQIPVPIDWVVTILDPIESLKEMYEEKVNGENS
jgi:hypothetical protein